MNIIKSFCRSFFFVFIVALQFLSCDKIELPVTGDVGGDDSPSKPPVVSPSDSTELGIPVCNVVQAFSQPVGTLVYVDAYIWGYVDGTTYSRATFGAPADKANTNMLIGDADACGEPLLCMPVKLKSNADGEWREIFNLYKQPELIGKRVRLCGVVIEYFKRKGLDKLMRYEWLDSKEEDADTPDDTPPTDDNKIEYPSINDTTEEIVSGRISRKIL